MKEYVHKMVLGTVQLGQQYGIANTSGVPSKKEALDILQTAWGSGIRCFDTAPGYQTEALIGEFVKAEGIQHEIRILTKIPRLGKSLDWKDLLCRTVTNSLAYLGSNYIETLFFHNADDSLLLLDDPKFFNELLEQFPIRSLGVSVYEPSEIERMKNSSFDLAFQFPFNLLDQRFEQNTVSVGKRYVRSIFLQGLLTSPSLNDKTPEKLKKFHALIKNDCQSNNLSLVGLAFSFILRAECLDYFLVGVESIQQLDELLTLDMSLDVDFTVLANKWRSVIAKEWLDPRKWN